jgi:DnaJ-class molecular chaperone
VQVRIPKGEKCDTCHGTGARTGTSAKTCGTCRGAGQVHMQQGPFSVQQPCPQCKGAGQVIDSIRLCLATATKNITKNITKTTATTEWISTTKTTTTCIAIYTCMAKLVVDLSFLLIG